MSNANDNTSTRLDALASELAELRNRQEIDNASIRELAQLGSQLMTAVIAQQQAIQAFAAAADEDRATFREEMRQAREESRQNREETRRIWEYLLGQQRNGNGGQGHQ